MSLYGYSRPTTPELDETCKGIILLIYPYSLRDVVTSQLYTQAHQQILTFANTNWASELFNSRPSMMKHDEASGFKTFWITNQQTMTERNTLLTAFSRQTDKQYYLNNDGSQSSRIYDDVVFALSKEALADPAERNLSLSIC